MEHSDTFAWYRDELHRAAQEQLFGVTSVGKLREYTEEELQSDVPSAEIPITLLEGNTINVRLSLAGYSIPGEKEDFHSTLDNLLRSISPKWNERREEELCAILDKLVAANSRD